MSSPLHFFLALVVLVAFNPLSSVASASPASESEQQVVQLQKKYQQLRSLEFDFSQSARTGGRVKQGFGNAVFYHSAPSGKDGVVGPSIMRWNYTGPVVQTIINDGKALSIYTPQDKQLIVSAMQDMEADITYAIFTGTKNLLDEFDALPADELFFLSTPPTDLEAILLTPKQPHHQVKRVQLWLHKDSTIHRLLMEDHFGALTELTFTKIRLNALPQQGNRQQRQQIQSLLKLDLAPGTEIIRQ